MGQRKDKEWEKIMDPCEKCGKSKALRGLVPQDPNACKCGD